MGTFPATDARTVGGSRVRKRALRHMQSKIRKRGCAVEASPSTFSKLGKIIGEDAGRKKGGPGQKGNGRQESTKRSSEDLPREIHQGRVEKVEKKSGGFGQRREAEKSMLQKGGGLTDAKDSTQGGSFTDSHQKKKGSIERKEGRIRRKDPRVKEKKEDQKKRPSEQKEQSKQNPNDQRKQMNHLH